MIYLRSLSVIWGKSKGISSQAYLLLEANLNNILSGLLFIKGKYKWHVFPGYLLKAILNEISS